MTLVLDLTNCDREGKRYAIEQGVIFDKVTFLHERNLTGWIPKGQIRTNYADKSGELVAEFAFSPIEHKSVLICGNPRMRSIIKPRLTVAQTQRLGEYWVMCHMVNRKARELAIIGRSAWVYDIEVSNNAEVLRVSQGFVEIDLAVTQPVISGGL